jgi:hypothetical protein
MLTDTNITNQTDIIFTADAVACFRQMGGGHSSAVHLSPCLPTATPRGVHGILVGHLEVFYLSVGKSVQKQSSQT